MPANLTPQYMEAEEAYKRATTADEKIAAVEEMLRTIPKHKGTEKLQADLRKRLARLRAEGRELRKKGKADPYCVQREGAGQVFVVGPPNSGKSALVGALTNAKVVVAPYPYATPLPVPGMMKYENIQIQLVDCPPISASNCPPALTASMRTGDGVMIVLDASSDSCLDDLDEQLALLRERKVIEDAKRFLIVASKIDLPDAAINADILAEACGEAQLVRVSTTSGHGICELPEIIFAMLGIIRLYPKPPGKEEPDRNSPVTLPAGSTVADLAEAIHRDLPQTMKGAKVWGSTRFGGQLAPREWVLEDGDIVEFRT